MNLDLWKEKTKGLFHITEYNEFWNYIDNMCNQNKNIEKAIKYIKEKQEIVNPEKTIYVNGNNLLNILKKGE